MPNFEHQQPGEKLELDAFEFNAMKDAGRAFVQSQGIANPTGRPPSVAFMPTVIRVYNDTGVNAERYRGFTLGTPRFTLDGDFSLATTVFNLRPYDASGGLAGAGIVCVTQEPIKQLEIGLAILAGPTLIEMEVSTDASFRFATPRATLGAGDNAGKFIPAANGQVQIPTAPSTTAESFVLAVLNNANFATAPSGAGLALTPTGGIPANYASRSCTVVNQLGATTASSVNLINYRSSDIPANTVVAYITDSNGWRYAIHTGAASLFSAGGSSS